MRRTEIGFLQKACGGKLLGKKDAFVTDVAIDSRAAGAGSLFVAVIGEKNDGHRYWESCLQNGCRAFLFSEKKRAQEVLAACPEASVILAGDTQEALVRMAEAYLAQFSPIRVGITGSVGKTTTRTLLAQVLSARYPTISSQKNLNTKLGNCLTCFLAGEDTQAAVFEMGMDQKGDISGYVSWIQPDAAILTNVGVSHLERLGSREAIAEAKLEITENLPPGAPLVVNRDSDYLSPEQIRQMAPGDYKIITVTQGGAGDYLVSGVQELGLSGIRFTLTERASGERVPVSLPLLGAHNALNAALAMAMGSQLGVGLREAARALSKVRPSERRLQAEDCGGILLIDDSYNACPDSMQAALGALASVGAKRTVAVLGDMLELGSDDEAGHVRVGQTAAEKKIDLIIAIGQKTAYYAKGVRSAKTDGGPMLLHFVDTDSAILALPGMLQKGDAVLVKGSNATGVSALAGWIRDTYR